MTPREYWKIIYRTSRIARREAVKAAADMMMFGTGVVFIPNDGGDPKHVPLKDMQAEVYGKSEMLSVLPDIKSLNKVVRDVLKTQEGN